MANGRYVVAVLAALSSSVFAAQTQKPNFTGTWLLVAPAEAAAKPPGQEETITQTDTTITFGHPAEGGHSHQLTCGLDGQPRESTIAGTRISCKGSWDAGRLVLVERTMTGSAPDNKADQTKTLHIDGNGSLIMEITPPIPDLPGGPAKLVWRKR